MSHTYICSWNITFFFLLRYLGRPLLSLHIVKLYYFKGGTRNSVLHMKIWAIRHLRVILSRIHNPGAQERDRLSMNVLGREGLSSPPQFPLLRGFMVTDWGICLLCLLSWKIWLNNEDFWVGRINFLLQRKPCLFFVTAYCPAKWSKICFCFLRRYPIKSLSH